jgi:O-antigen/teichoic acid export membrane protein
MRPVGDRQRIGPRAHLSTWRGTADLTRKAALTSVAQALDYGARLLVQFVINPILVAGLGSALYGTWRVLWQMSGYLWAAGGRSAQALQWIVTNRQSSTDDDQKRAYVGSAVIVWLIFLPVLVVIGGIAAWFAPVLLDTPARWVGEVRVAGALLVVDAVALTLLTVPRSVLQGQNLGYRRMGLSALLVVLNGGLMALAIVMGFGITGVAAGNLLGTLVTGVVFWRLTRVYVPWFGISRPPRKVFRWVLGLSGWFMGWKFVYELMIASDVLVLGIFASVRLVTVYTLTKAIPDALVLLTGILVSGSAPGLGGIVGEGKHRKARRLRNEIMALSWLVTVVVGGGVLLWNRSFVTLWVGPEFYAGGFATLLIVLLAIQFAFIANDARVIDMTLNVRAKVLLGGVSGVVSFGLAVFLQKETPDPIIGMCLGILAGRSILMVAYPLTVGRHLHHPLLSQVAGAIRPILVTVALFGACLLLGHRLLVESWPELVGAAFVSAVVLAAVAGAAGLNKAQRAKILARTRHALRPQEVSPDA